MISHKTQLGGAPVYAFLSQPPPQKKRPTLPLSEPPLRPLPPTPIRVVRPSRRSSFTSRISAWASHVQPGSPAPVSPHRRPSVSRRPLNLGLSSLTAGIGHARVPSSPFIVTPTPTTASHKTFDFTTVGYNTNFVHMQETPETPSPLLRAKAQKEQELYEEKRREKALAKEESKEKRSKMMKKIKSLTNLRLRAKSVFKDAAIPNRPLSPVGPIPSPTFTPATAPVPSKSKSKLESKKSTTSKASKKAIYGPLFRPPPLANELALMQFADGGKMEDHIKRTMTAESGAVSDVYRDGKGGVWWDKEEEMEYRGLLVDADSSDHGEINSEEKEDHGAVSWVKFQSQANGLSTPAWVKAGEQLLVERRDSASSASILDSDLDPAYLMQTDDAPAYHDERILNFELSGGSKDLEKPNDAAIKPGAMLLSLPARPFRAAKHLRKPEIMVDMKAFGLAMSNAAAEAAASKSPRTPLFPVNFASTAHAVVSRRVSRKRPAPLKISPGMMKMRKVVAVSSPALVPLVVDAQHMHQLVRDGKREFMMDSFQPGISTFEDDSEYDFVEQSKKMSSENGIKKRASRLDLRGMFRRSSK